LKIKAILQQFNAMPNHGISSNMLFYILNLHTQNYEFISPASMALTGYPPEVYYSKGTSFLTSLLIPGDFKQLSTHIFPEMNKVVTELPGPERGKAIFELHYRMLHANGKVVNCIEQSSYAKFDAGFTPLISSGIVMEVSPLINSNGVRGLVRLVKDQEQFTMYDQFYSYTDFKLSLREKEIALLVTQGKTSKEIAEILYISEHTARQHRKNILKKLGVTSSSDLVRKLIENKLV
jgi:DNA-binding CsgD family transcriptional regulator